MYPFQLLNDEQKQRVRDSLIKIAGEQVKISDVDEIQNPRNVEEFLNSLTQKQIDAILAGKLIDWEDKSPMVAETSQQKVDEGDEDVLTHSIRPFKVVHARGKKAPNVKVLPQKLNFQSLNVEQKEKVRNAMVQFPGNEIDSLRNFVNNDETFYEYLSHEQINEMLNDNLVVFFGPLCEAFDNFEKTKGATGNTNESHYGSGNDSNYPSQSSHNANSLSDDSNSSNENRSFQRNHDEERDDDDDNSNIAFEKVDDFLKENYENRTIIVMKKSASNQSLYYTHIYMRKKYRGTTKMITFYINFNDIKYKNILENISRQTNFLDKLYVLTEAKDNFEKHWIEKNYPRGGIFWIMDNIEYFKVDKDEKLETKLNSIILEIIKELRFNNTEPKVERNWQIVGSNLDNAMKRSYQLDSPVYSVEKRAVENAMDTSDIIISSANGSNKTVIISIKKFKE